MIDILVLVTLIRKQWVMNGTVTFFNIDYFVNCRYEQYRTEVAAAEQLTSSATEWELESTVGTVLTNSFDLSIQTSAHTVK